MRVVHESRGVTYTLVKVEDGIAHVLESFLVRNPECPVAVIDLETFTDARHLVEVVNKTHRMPLNVFRERFGQEADL